MSIYTFVSYFMELRQKRREEIDFYQKKREKLIENVGLKGLKFTNLKYQLVEALNNYLGDTIV